MKKFKRSSLENYTSSSTTQPETIQHNTKQHEYNTTQHDTTRVQHETTQVQNNIKFTLIYLCHCCLLGAWYIRLYTSVYIVNPRKLKIAFSSNSQNRTRKSQGSVGCNCVFVFLLIEIILIVSFFRFETFYEKAFE